MKPWSRICKNDGNNWLACSQPNRNHTSILEERNMQWEGCYVTRQEGGRQGYRSPTKNNVRNLTNEHGAMHWLDWNHIFLPMTTRLQKCPLPLSLSLSLSLALSLSLSLSLSFSSPKRKHQRHFSVQQLEQQQQQSIWFNTEEREWDSVQVSHYKSNKLMHSVRLNFNCTTAHCSPLTKELSKCIGISPTQCVLMIYMIGPALLETISRKF